MAFIMPKFRSCYMQCCVSLYYAYYDKSLSTIFDYCMSCSKQACMLRKCCLFMDVC